MFYSEALSPFRLTRILRCVLFPLSQGWIGPPLSRPCGEGSKSFVKVYYFVHRNILPLCIFRLWTRASLNFGELNLYSALQLKKVTSSRERMLKEILIWFSSFSFLSQGFVFVFFYLFKEGLHLPLLSFSLVFVNVIYTSCIVFDSYRGQKWKRNIAKSLTLVIFCIWIKAKCLLCS